MEPGPEEDGAELLLAGASTPKCVGAQAGGRDLEERL